MTAAATLPLPAVPRSRPSRLLQAGALAAIAGAAAGLWPQVSRALEGERATSAAQLGSLPVKCRLPPPSHPRAVYVRYPGGGFEAADRVTRARVCRSANGLVETADSRLFAASEVLEYTEKGTSGPVVLELGPGWTVATREDRG